MDVCEKHMHVNLIQLHSTLDLTYRNVTVGIKDSLVRDNLQNGTMISMPFRKENTVVLCTLVGK